jgi:hypothetical protein
MEGKCDEVPVLGVLTYGPQDGKFSSKVSMEEN